MTVSADQVGERAARRAREAHTVSREPDETLPLLKIHRRALCDQVHRTTGFAVEEQAVGGWFDSRSVCIRTRAAV